MPLTDEQRAALKAEIANDPDGLGYAGKSPEQIRALVICPDRPKTVAPVESTRAVSRIAALGAIPALVAAEVALREAAASSAEASLVLDVWTRHDVDWASDLGAALLALWPHLDAKDAAALRALCVFTVQPPPEYHPQRRAVVLGRSVKLATADIAAVLAEIGA